ncbi:unnamed protein product, partial [Polarella glacialis]
LPGRQGAVTPQRPSAAFTPRVSLTPPGPQLPLASVAAPVPTVDGFPASWTEASHSPAPPGPCGVPGRASMAGGLLQQQVASVAAPVGPRLQYAVGPQAQLSSTPRPSQVSAAATPPVPGAAFVPGGALELQSRLISLEQSLRDLKAELE